MELHFEGKIAVVTGAAKGIGAAVAQAFIKEGAAAVAIDRDENGLRQLSESLGDNADRLYTVVADLSTEDGIQDAVEAAQKFWDAAPDVLVNNVGVGSLRGLDETTDEEFHRTLELNLFGMVRMTKALVPLMYAAGRGSVVSLTSDLSRQQEDVITDYAASKAAVAAVSKSLARKYAPRVRLNCVAPGPILTPFWSDESYGWQKNVEEAYGAKGQAALDALISDRGIPMGRMGTPEEVAAAVLFLASDVSAFTTGATLGVDGGSVRSIF